MFRQPLKALLLSHPFELLISFWGVITGIPLALHLLPTSPATEKLDPTMLSLFGVTLAFGGAAAMVGMYLFFKSKDFVRQIVGMRVEQAGWVGIAAAILTLLILIFAVGNPGSAVGVATYLAIIGACACRWLQLRNTIQAYGKTLLDRSEGNGSDNGGGSE